MSTLKKDAIARYRAQTFALANKLWADNLARKDEELHLLVEGITGKQSIKLLDTMQFAQVVRELEARLTARGIPARFNTSKQTVKKIVAPLQSKVFRLMYLLIDCDEVPDKSTLGIRLCGIIKRQFGIDATAKDPCAWLTQRQVHQLIEILKGYVDSAQALKERREATP